MKPVHIGTSGWNYDHWKGSFYDKACPKIRWLEFYAGIFSTIEVNASFYRKMKPETFEKWYTRTPEDFLWSVKANRYITHIRRLTDAGEPLGVFFTSLKPLKNKLGPILFQLPPSLVFDRLMLESFCRHLNPDYRYTIEARHTSWTGKDALAILKEHNIAWCIADTAGRYPYHEAITADFVYIRLHGSQELYASKYSEEELASWAARIRKWDLEAFVYFDNDYQAYAPHNALRLKEIMQEANRDDYSNLEKNRST